MITFSRAYTTSDGALHLTLEDAQKHELRQLLAIAPETAGAILEGKDRIMDILTMRDSALPRARKINGGTKKRKARHNGPLPTLDGAQEQSA